MCRVAKYHEVSRIAHTCGRGWWCGVPTSKERLPSACSKWASNQAVARRVGGSVSCLAGRHVSRMLNLDGSMAPVYCTRQTNRQIWAGHCLRSSPKHRFAPHFLLACIDGLIVLLQRLIQQHPPAITNKAGQHTMHGSFSLLKDN